MLRLKMNALERIGDGELVLDCSDIIGTNAYCDAAARDELRRRIELYDVKGVHLIGSGNYHYLSLLWIERLETDFALILFDHHTDCQEPAFSGITSCGGWVREALVTLPNLKKVYMVGPNRDKVAEDLADLAEADGFLGQIIMGIPPSDEHLPLYISIDTDILAPEYAACDWEQGDMSLSELLMLLSECCFKHMVLGADICGEKSVPSDEEYMMNLSTRMELCRVLNM